MLITQIIAIVNAWQDAFYKILHKNFSSFL